MVERNLRVFLWHSAKVSLLLVFAILKHPRYKAMRNQVGNFVVLDKEGEYRGYIDYYNGELVLFK